MSQKQVRQQPVSRLKTETDLFSRAAWLQSLFVFGFAFLLYANTISHDYAVDDTIVITKSTLTPKGFKGIPKIMTTDAFYGFFGQGYKLVEGGRYRPLSIATFAVESRLFGKVVRDSQGKPFLDKDGDKNYTGNPKVSHAVNVLLFGATGALLYFLFLLLLNQSPPSIVALNLPLVIALLFVAHPIHTEAVANIKGRDEVMGLLGSLSALFFAVLYVKREKISFLLAALASFVLALLSKENPITYLAVIPLAYYFFTNAGLKKYAATLLPLLAIAGIYVFVRKYCTYLSPEERADDIAKNISKVIADWGKSAQERSPEILNNPFVDMNNPSKDIATPQKTATIALSFLNYLKLLFFPHPLTHDYYYNQVPRITWGDPRALISFVINGALLVYALLSLPKRALHSFAILYYFITISIVSNIPFTVGIIMNERFLFMPSVGFSVLLAMLLVMASNYISAKSFDYKTVANNKLLAGLLALTLAGYSLKTVSRNADWKNDFELFKADVKNSPNSAKIHNALGGEYLTQSDKPGLDAETKKEYILQSEKALARALEIYPDYMNALLLMGNAKYKINDSLPEAEYYYKRALKMKPAYFEGNFNLGCVYLEKNFAKESIPYFRKAIEIKPQKFEAYYNAAEAYFKINQPDSAIYFYRKVTGMTGDAKRIALCYYKIGLCYGKMKNDLDNAIVHLTKATELDPVNILYYEDLGVAYGFKQDFKNAIRVLEKAIEMNPKYAKAYYNLGITYRQLGQEAKAQEYFAKAAELDAALRF